MRRALVMLVLVGLSGCATPDGIKMHHKPRGDDGFGPWSTSVTAPTVASTAHGGSAAERRDDEFVDFVYGAYSGYLTKIDGARCEHRPTCSRYAMLALKKHGYLLGSWMTIDRLLRGRKSSILRELEIYKIEDGARYHYDPVENNDFFF